MSNKLTHAGTPAPANVEGTRPAPGYGACWCEWDYHDRHPVAGSYTASWPQAVNADCPIHGTPVTGDPVAEEAAPEASTPTPRFTDFRTPFTFPTPVEQTDPQTGTSADTHA